MSRRSDTKYDCYLCDYEGKCYYDRNDIILHDEAYCYKCEYESRIRFLERNRGEPKIWDGNGYIGEFYIRM